MQVAPGITIGGKYTVEQPLARGGMGAVWVARHVKLGNPVAIKFLDAHLAAAPALVARFEREARAAANLDTPHVVKVHDYGVEEGTPYLVMELLRGEDLNSRLRARRRLSLGEAAKILTQMGRALRRAHEAGLVHRDLKPANVFLARVEDDEVVKVLDFGIAKETWSRVEDATKTGEVFGSPHYMSPEQARAQKTVDRRADIWACGVIAYRMLTGRLPFPGEALGEVLSSVLVDPFPPIAEVAPDLPSALEGFFGTALAKNKEARFSSITEMVDAFNSITSCAPSPSGPGDSASPEVPATSVAHAEIVATIDSAAPTPIRSVPDPPTTPLPAAAASLPATHEATSPSVASSTRSVAPGAEHAPSSKAGVWWGLAILSALLIGAAAWFLFAAPPSRGDVSPSAARSAEPPADAPPLLGSHGVFTGTQSVTAVSAEPALPATVAPRASTTPTTPLAPSAKPRPATVGALSPTTAVTLSQPTPSPIKAATSSPASTASSSPGADDEWGIPAKRGSGQ